MDIHSQKDKTSTSPTRWAPRKLIRFVEPFQPDTLTVIPKRQANSQSSKIPPLSALYKIHFKAVQPSTLTFKSGRQAISQSIIYTLSQSSIRFIPKQPSQVHHHHHHHLSLNREGRRGTTDDLATSFLHFLCSPLPPGTCRTPGLSIP